VLVDFRDRVALPVAPGVIVIVGSGAAGLALSLTLGDHGRPVLLLESGGEVRDARAASDAARLNEGVVAGLPFHLEIGRARGLGGTSNLWHGQCMRLHEIDLRERAWVPHSGWPITLNRLSHYYPLAERWIGVSGKGYDETRWAEHPRLTPIPWTPDHLLHDFTEYARYPRLARRYQGRIRRHPLVCVVVNATVSRVLVQGGRVGAVEVLGHDGRRETVPASQVILAAGAIENARLLQLSDPAGVGLGLGRQLTGRFLQSHPIIRMADVRAADFAFLQDRYVVLRHRRRRLFPKVRLAPAAQERHQLLDATAVFLHEHDDPALDAVHQLVLAARARRWPDAPGRAVLRGLGSPTPLVRDAYRRLVHGLPTGSAPSRVSLELWLEQAPDAGSRVTLDRTRDPLGLPRARVTWRCGEQEIRTSRALTRLIAGDLTKLGIARLIELASMRDDEAWLASMRDAAHAAGTTRMSADPRHGVVDADLQVHGVAGLFVIGGSVFPTSGYANPTLTIVALAIRLGEHLVGLATATGPDRSP
jgi:choline dehydrogenase-like flavoprotein